MKGYEERVQPDQPDNSGISGNPHARLTLRKILSRRGDDSRREARLLGFVRQQLREGSEQMAGEALAIAVYNRRAWIRKRVARKVPSHNVECVTDAVIDSTIPSLLRGRDSFRGESVGELCSWLNTVIKRRIADFHRRRNCDEISLDESGAVNVKALVAGGPDVEILWQRQTIEEALINLSPRHQRVVIDTEIRGLKAGEVAQEDSSLTPDNIYKIRQRFRESVLSAYAGSS